MYSQYMGKRSLPFVVVFQNSVRQIAVPRSTPQHAGSMVRPNNTRRDIPILALIVVGDRPQIHFGSFSQNGTMPLFCSLVGVESLRRRDTDRTLLNRL